MYAMSENVIIETFARRVGDEIKMGSIIVGKEEVGEVPEWGVLVDIGSNVPENMNVGDIVLIPNGRMAHVPDPRVVEGTLTKDDPKRRQLVVTHWRNIQVNYGNKNA